MIKSLKTLLGLSLLGFFGVWTGCSSDSAPVAPYSASKTHDTTPTTSTDDSATAVVITDANLRIAIEFAILALPSTPAGGLPATLTRGDLRGLEVLKAGGNGIKSLSGLEFATNLDTLELQKDL